MVFNRKAEQSKSQLTDLKSKTISNIFGFLFGIKILGCTIVTGPRSPLTANLEKEFYWQVVTAAKRIKI